MLQAGLIEQQGDRWFATKAGAEAVGPVETPPPPGPDLVRWWAARIPGTRKIVEPLIDAYPAPIDSDELALRADLAVSGGTFGTYLRRLEGPGLITRRDGTVALNPEVME